MRVELPPGTVVREDDLQERLGIGRTPIREALQRLEREQLVSIIPRRGVMVTPIDVGDLALLFESRSILEPYVHRLAAKRGDARHWDVMEQALAATDGVEAWDEHGVDDPARNIGFELSQRIGGHDVNSR